MWSFLFIHLIRCLRKKVKSKHLQASLIMLPNLQLWLLPFCFTDITLWILPFKVGCFHPFSSYVTQHLTSHYIPQIFRKLWLLEDWPIWCLYLSFHSLTVILYPPRFVLTSTTWLPLIMIFSKRRKDIFLRKQMYYLEYFVTFLCIKVLLRIVL